MAVLIPGVNFLRKDFSYRKLSAPDNPKLLNFDLFEKKFGNDDSISVIIHNEKGIFNRELLLKIRELENALQQVPGTMRTESLLDGNVINTVGDSIEIKGLIPKKELDHLSDVELLKLKEKANSTPQIASYLVSPDSTITFIHLFMNPTKLHTQNEVYDYSIRVEKVVDQFKQNFNDSQILLSGSAYLGKTVIEVSKNDLNRLSPIIVIVYSLIAFLIFRSIKGVLILLLLIIINVLAVLGIQGYLDFPITSFSSGVGIIVTVVTTGSMMHVMAGFYRYYFKSGDKLGALIQTYSTNLIPTFLTTFTTCIGFLALADKSLRPVYELGILLGIGSMISWILIFTIIGPILRACHKQKIPVTLDQFGLPNFVTEKDKATTPFAKKYIGKIFKYKNTIIVLWLLAMIASILCIPLLEIRMNPFTQYSERIPIVSTRNLIQKKFGFTLYNDLLIDTGKADGAKDAALLKRLDDFEKEILQDKNLVKNVSITAIIKELNQTFNNGNSDFYTIPDKSDAIAQFLLLYSFSDNGKLKNFMSPDGRYLKSTIFTTLSDSNKVLAQMDQIESIAKKHDLNLKVTGKIPLFMELGLVIFKVIAQSALFSLLFIAIIMFVFVRNTKLGIMAMIPNVVPVLLGGGVLYLLNYGIDISTTLIFSVCLGIAVDDTIHFMHHWLHLKKEGKTSIEALEIIVVNLFPMVIATTIILSCGFSVMAFADFLPNIKFGILTAIILFLAMMADLFFLPAILLKEKFFD